MECGVQLSQNQGTWGQGYRKLSLDVELLHQSWLLYIAPAASWEEGPLIGARLRCGKC